MNHYRMADREFRHKQRIRLKQQIENRDIRRLVVCLRKRGLGFVPHVAPSYGGNEAKILLLLSDPGPKADQQGRSEAAGGSGFLSHENADPTARRIARMLGEAGLLVDDGPYPNAKAPSVIAWNACPWMLDRTSEKKIRAPRVMEKRRGHEPLLQLLRILPRLKVIIPMGKVAEDACTRFTETEDGKRILDLITSQGITQLEATCHPSNQGVRSVDGGEGQILIRFKEAATVIGPC